MAQVMIRHHRYKSRNCIYIGIHKREEGFVQDICISNTVLFSVLQPTDLCFNDICFFTYNIAIIQNYYIFKWSHCKINKSKYIAKYFIDSLDKCGFSIYSHQQQAILGFHSRSVEGGAE